MAEGINNVFYGNGAEWGTIFAGIVAALQQSGKSTEQINDVLESIKKLPGMSDIEEMFAAHDKKISRSITTAKTAIIKKIDELKSVPGVDNTAQIEKLQETLDRVEGLLSGKFELTENLLKDIKTILVVMSERQETTDKKLDELLGRGTKPGETPVPPAGDNNPPKGGPVPPVGDNQPPKGGPVPPAGDNNPPKGGPIPPAGDNNPPKGGPVPPAGDNQPPKGGPVPPAGDNNPPKGGQTPPPAKPTKPKLKRVKFVQKSINQTKILSEAKQPWYKRLATFAIKHPIVSVVAGAGLGLGLFGLGCGVAALAGGTSFLTAVNMLIPSIPGFVGLGALGGGAVSVASNTLPKGQWGLYAKAGRLFGKVGKINKNKQWVADFQTQQQKAKEAAVQRHKSSYGLVKKLKVHKAVSKVHKLAERTAKRLGKLYARKLVRTTGKALDVKKKLNEKEGRSGRSQALAGYLQKKRRAERKLESGRYTQEEYDERVEELDEDYADRDGGEPGLIDVDTRHKTGHRTFDLDAVNAIEAIKKMTSEHNETQEEIIRRHTRRIKYGEPQVIGVELIKEEEFDALQIEEKRKEYEKSKNGEVVAIVEDVPEDEVEAGK